MSSEARPRNLAIRTAASILALAVGAIGVVGFASAATAASDICVPSDAVTHTEHTYARTVTQWAAASPGDEWSATGRQAVVVDSPAITRVELEYRKLKQGGYDYHWYRQDNPPNANSGWEPSGDSRVVVVTPAVTHVEHEFAKTESTGWLTESPGSEWTIVDTRVVTDSEAVVCEVTASLTANGYRFRPGDTIDLNAFDFLAGEDIEFVLNSEPVLLAHAPASTLGSAAVRSIVIPADTAPGMHTIVATGLTSGRTASVTIEVLPADAATGPDTAAPASRTAPAAPAPAELAETGNESLALLGLAGSLALIGAGLVGMRRRAELI